MALGTILGGAQAAMSLAGLIASLSQGSKQQKYPPGFAQAMQQLHNSEQYSGWAADPTSEAHQNIAAGDKQAMWLDILDGIRNIQHTNQRAQARGVGGISNARGRDDENQFRTIAREFMRAGLRSRTMATDKLMALAGQAQARAGGYNNLSRTGLVTDLFNRQNQNQSMSGAIQGFPAVLQGIGKMFGGSSGGGIHNSLHSGFAAPGSPPMANRFNTLISSVPSGFWDRR